MNRGFTEKEIYMAKKHVERYWVSLVIKEKLRQQWVNIYLTDWQKLQSLLIQGIGKDVDIHSFIQ